MIDILTLQYNQARQAAITKELLEIVGGAEALKREERHGDEHRQDLAGHRPGRRRRVRAGPAAGHLQRAHDQGRRAQGRSGNLDRSRSRSTSATTRARDRDGLDRRPRPRHGRSTDTGAPITVPVGEETPRPHLQRARRADRRQGPAVNADEDATRSTAPAPAVRGPGDERRDVRDRHQGRRPARAVREGRQDRPLRRRRRRQDRAHPGADPQHRQAARRLLGVRRRRRAHARGQRPLPRDDRSRASSRRPRWSSAR